MLRHLVEGEGPLQAARQLGHPHRRPLKHHGAVAAARIHLCDFLLSKKNKQTRAQVSEATLNSPTPTAFCCPSRGAAYVLVGATVGWVVEGRRRRGEAELVASSRVHEVQHRADPRQVQRRQAARHLALVERQRLRAPAHTKKKTNTSQTNNARAATTNNVRANVSPSKNKHARLNNAAQRYRHLRQ